MTYSEQIHQMAALCRQDPAFIQGIKDALRDSGLGTLCGFTVPPKAVDGPPPPFPGVAAITAIQTSIFDNWPQGRAVKGIPSRYGIALEVWTQDAEDIVIRKGRKPNFQHKSQMALMDGANLKRQIRDLKRKPRRTPIDPGYLDHMEELAEALPAGNLVGLINTNIINDDSGYNRGTHYHSYQFVCVEMEDGLPFRAVLYLGSEQTELAAFATTDAGGNPFAGRVIAQSRDDRCGLSPSWGTNEV